MLPSRYFMDLTQPEIAAQLKKHPLVILPQGSVEQHGPHLPAGTDIFAANVIAHAVAERMDGLVLPGGPLGVTPLHMPFEGTVTLSPETYMRVVIETCASAACFVAEELFGEECNGLTHGGEIETLAVLAYRPELVHIDRIDRSSDHVHGQKMDALRRTRAYQPVLTDVRSIAPTGWYGSPQFATVEKAQRMLNSVADSIARKSAEILEQLDKLRGGIAEIKTFGKAR